MLRIIVNRMSLLAYFEVTTLSLTEETIVQQVHYYTLLDTRMLEHTTDDSTDVIKMTVYSASCTTTIFWYTKYKEN